MMQFMKKFLGKGEHVMEAKKCPYLVNLEKQSGGEILITVDPVPVAVGSFEPYEELMERLRQTARSYKYYSLNQLQKIMEKIINSEIEQGLLEDFTAKNSDEILYTAQDGSVISFGAKKPPLGVIPRYLHEENRRESLARAITSFTEAGLEISPEWVEEYNELTKKIAGRKENA